MEGATFYGTNVDSCPDQLLGGNFRSKCVTNAHNDPAVAFSEMFQQEFRIFFPQQIGLVTVFVQGYCAGDGNDFASLVGTKLYFSSLGPTDNTYTVAGTEIKNQIQQQVTSSGYYSTNPYAFFGSANNYQTGTTLHITRLVRGGAGTSWPNQNQLALSQIRVYSSYEMTLKYGNQMHASPSSTPGWTMNSFYKSGDTAGMFLRTCGNDMPAYKNTGGGIYDTSCYKADQTSVPDGKLTISHEMYELPWYYGAILIMEDHRSNEDESVYNINNFLHDYRVYIGKSADPSECTECSGGPFMTATSGYDADGKWKFGNEIWCNLSGHWLHIVADYSAIPTWDVSVCDVSIMGNYYLPSGAVPVGQNKLAGEEHIWTLSQIYVPETTNGGHTIVSAWRLKAGQGLPDWIYITGNQMYAQIPSDQVSGSFTITVETYDSTSTVSSALLTHDVVLNIQGTPTPFFTETMLTEITITIGLDQDWTLPVVDLDTTPLTSLQVVLSDFTDSDLATDLTQVERRDLDYILRYVYTTSISEGTGTFKIRTQSTNNSRGTDYTIAYNLQNPSPPTFSSTPTATVAVIEKVVSFFTYPSIVAGELGSSTIVITVQDMTLYTHYTWDSAQSKITFTASHQFYTDNKGQSKTITIKVQDDTGSETEYTQTLTIAAYVPPTTTVVPPVDFSFQNGVSETKAVISLIAGSIPLNNCAVSLAASGAFNGLTDNFQNDGGDLEPNIPTNQIEWTYRGNSYSDASLLDTPHLFKYELNDNEGQLFYFEHYFTLRSQAALSPPTFQTTPANLVIMSGVFFVFDYPAVSIGTYNKVLASYTLSDNNVGSWLANNLPQSSFGAYDITSEHYTTWKDASFATALSYDGSTNIESFASDSSLAVTVVLTDRMQETGQSTYTQTITVQIAEAPTFAQSLADPFSLYTSEAKDLVLPTVVVGNFGMDQAITFSTSNADFASTLSINVNAPFLLSYDGSFATAHTGTITITLSNSVGKSTDYTTNYELLAPVAPSFTSAVADFTVVVGFDKTYSFSTIENGSHSPVTFSLAATVLSPSQYTFDDVARTITLLGSQSSYDSLAGSSITLTSTLNHAQASDSFTQTVTIAAYVLPTFSETLSLIQLFPGQAKTVQYPSITIGSWNLAPTTVTVTPSTLVEYLSFTQAVGVQQDGGKPVVEIYFPMNTLNLEFGGNSILRDQNLFGFFTFQFTLSDIEGGQTQVSQQVEIRDAVAPTFATTPSTQFEITQRTPFSYDFPLLTEGDLTPATATITMTTGLETSLVITQAQNGDNKLQISASYSGGNEIRSFADQASLTVNIRLTDEAGISFTDYTISVTVAPIVYPVFTTDLETEYKVYPGVPWVFTLPAVTDGSRALQTLTFTTSPAQLDAGLALNEASSDPRQLSYSGSILDEVYIGAQSITFTLTNVEGDITAYTKTFTVEKYVLMAFDSEVQDIRVVENYPTAYIFPTITAGTMSIASKIVTHANEIDASLVQFDAENLILTIQGQNLSPALIGNSYDFTIKVIDTADQFVTVTKQVKFESEILPSFTDSLPPKVNLYRNVTANFEYPKIDSGSFSLLSLDFSVSPESLGLYMSTTQALGEPQTTSEKPVVLAFNQTSSLLDFTDNQVLINDNIVGDFEVTWVIKNQKNLFSPKQTFSVIEPTPPSIVEEVSTNLQVQVKEQILDKEYLTVVEGTFSPATASWTMSPDLEQYLIVSETKVEDKTKIKISYNGGEGLKSVAGKSDLFFKVKIEDAIKRTSVEYESTVTVIAPKVDAAGSEAAQAAGDKAAGDLLGAPYFEKDVETTYTVFSDDVLIELGDPIDPQESEISISFDLSEVQNFIQASGSKLTMLDGINNAPIGVYTVKVELSSQFESKVLSQVYSFKIDIQEPEKSDDQESKSSEELVKEDEVQNEQDINLPEEMQLAPEAVIKELQEGLGSVGGLPPNIVIPPMTNRQVSIAKSPAADIPADLLFVSVPLAARVTSGVTNTRDVILRQRQLVTENAINSASGSGPRLPEARIQKISNANSLKVKFTNTMNVSDADAENLKTQRLRNRRLEAEGKTPEKEKVTMFAVKEEGTDESELGEPIMGGWEIKSFGADGIEFDLNFTNPIYVSTGEEADLLLVQLDLSEFKDENGVALPESVVKYLPIPTQMSSLEEVKQVEDQGTSATESSKTAVITNAVINVFLGQSMKKIWDMIEGLQIAYHLPLFKVRTPGNVQSFNAFFDEIGGFDFVDVDIINGKIFYFPEFDSLNINFQSMGFGSTLIIQNLGTLLYLLLIHMCLVPVVLILHYLGKKCRKLQGVSNKASRYLFFNGTIRFLMEGYLDICLFSLINMKNLDWTPIIAITISNYIAIFLTLVVCGFPIFACFWYLYKMNSWDDPDFQNRWGQMLEDIDTDKEDKSLKGMAIIFPLSYFIRRLTFCIVIVFWIEFLWGQVAIMCMISVALIIYNNLAQPMESRFATNMENFNEMIALGVLYIMMALSDGNPNVVTRQIFGGIFIGVVCFYLAFHISILFIDICYKVKFWFKKKNFCALKKTPLTKEQVVERKKKRTDEISLLQKSIYKNKKRAKDAHEKRLALNESQEASSKDQLSDSDQEKHNSPLEPEQVVVIKSTQPEPDFIIQIKPMTTPRFGVQPAPLREEDDFVQSQRYSEVSSSRELIAEDSSKDPASFFNIASSVKVTAESNKDPASFFNAGATEPVKEKKITSRVRVRAPNMGLADVVQPTTRVPSADQFADSLKWARAVAGLNTLTKRNNKPDLLIRESVESVETDEDKDVMANASPNIHAMQAQFNKLSISDISLDDDDKSC